MQSRVCMLRSEYDIMNLGHLIGKALSLINVRKHVELSYTKIRKTGNSGGKKSTGSYVEKEDGK